MLLAVLLVAGCGLVGGRDADTGAGEGPSAAADDGPPSPAPPAGAPGDDGPDDPARHATLGPWEPCRVSFECATLTVPRDWADVDGAPLDLAVMRLPASGDRIGSVVLNPGGPGASGVDFLEGYAAGRLPAGLDERFDVVAWDPRGTGASAPITCTSDEELLAPDLDPTPDGPDDVAAIRAEVESSVAACREAAGDLLELVGTRATTRDLDALRGALGDERLTYVGFSYGTTIGMEYLRAYPDRVRAVVLDAVALPGVDPVEDARTQGLGFERALDAYLDGCATRPSCPLGPTPKDDLLDLVDRLERGPVPASYTLGAPGAEPRPGELGIGELYIAVASTLYTRSSWPTLDAGLAEARADPPSGRTLLAQRDAYLGRRPDGTWRSDLDARVAIRCADQAARARAPEGDLALADAWTVDMPFWGAWFASGTPGCWGFPAAREPLEPLGAGAVSGVPPVVVIGATDDPATPYEQAEDAQRAIDGSVLVTFEGAEHTTYKRISDCIDDAVTTYLVDLTPPPAGLRC